MRIRPYRHEVDQAAVLAVFDRAFPNAHPFLEGMGHFEGAREVVRQSLPHWHACVAEAERGIAGFIIVRDDGHICALFVDPILWNRGLGTALLEAGQKHYPCLTLQVFEENSAAVRFYRKRGFQVVDEERAIDSRGAGHYRLMMERLGV